MALWAHQEYLNNCGELELGLQAEMMKVIAMEEGPEFEMTEHKIQEFADGLENSN